MKLFAVLVLSFFTFQPISCMNMNNFSQYELPKEDRIVNKILEQAASLIKKKHNIHPIGTNVRMPNGDVRKLGIHFEVYKYLSKNEIRKILLDSAQQLLNLINNSLEIKPYLNVYPFTLDNIEVTLFFSENGLNNNGTGIDIASIEDKELIYTTLIDVNNIPKLKKEETESYEDALSLVQSLTYK